MTAFTFSSARSGSLLGAVILIISVETVVLHLWIAPRHPGIAWALTAGSLLTIAWLVADYRALAHGDVRVDDGQLALAIGRRATGVIPLAEVEDVRRPSWRDVPDGQSPAAMRYLNPLKPASPNILVTLRTPVEIRVLGRIQRPVQRLGLCLDDPDAFVATMLATQVHQTL